MSRSYEDVCNDLEKAHKTSEAAARAIKERKGDRAALAEAFRSAITRVHELENELLFMP